MSISLQPWTKTYNGIPLVWTCIHFESKWKNKISNWEKLMTEFELYNQLDPGAINVKKPRYESEKMVLNQARNWAEKQQEYFRVAIIN